MKAILISDHAIWCALMMKGIKKAEVRKGTALYKATQKLIEENGYAEFYVYCTKGKPNLWLPYEYDCFELDEASQPYLSDEPMLDVDTKMNGKVIFKFRCYKVEEIKFHCLTKTNAYGVQRIETTFKTQTLAFTELKKLSCLTGDDLMKYLNDADGYAIHISALEIFDRPKELSDFKPYTCNKCDFQLCSYCNIRPLAKAPQSYMYVETEGDK